MKIRFTSSVLEKKFEHSTNFYRYEFLLSAGKRYEKKTNINNFRDATFAEIYGHFVQIR